MTHPKHLNLKHFGYIFEGDGAISAIRFSNGQVFTAARVIQSASLAEERTAGRHLGSFAASWPERLKRMHTGRFKNTANTHVIVWQNRLFALMEGSKPTEIDPESLSTLGETDLDGEIPGAFSAHPHRVESRKTLYNFGLSYGKQTLLNLFALPDTGNAQRIGQISLPHPVMMHDFIVTENFLVFFVCPVRVKVWRMMLALRTFADNFSWTPTDGTEIIVVPIDNPEQTKRFHTDAFHVFHFAAAYEEAGKIVVDYVHYADSQLLDVLGDGTRLSWTDPNTHVFGTLHRARIDVNKRKFQTAHRWDAYCEFPRILNSSTSTFQQNIWLQSSRFIDGILRFGISRIDAQNNLQHHLLAAGEICSEPVLSQQAGAAVEQSSVMTIVYNSHTDRSHVLILEAQSLSLQARVQLTQAIPLTFHGSWFPTSTNAVSS